MEKWLIAVICLAIAVVAVLFVSIIKVIAKKNAERKGKEMDMKKAEFPLALSAFVLAFCGVAAFLYFYIKLQIGAALGSATLYGFATEGIYILVLQLARKGLKGAIKNVIEIIGKLKKSKNPIAELPGIIDEATTDNETETNDKIGEKLYDEIFKENK